MAKRCICIAAVAVVRTDNYCLVFHVRVSGALMPVQGFSQNSKVFPAFAPPIWLRPAAFENGIPKTLHNKVIKTNIVVIFGLFYSCLRTLLLRHAFAYCSRVFFSALAGFSEHVTGSRNTVLLLIMNVIMNVTLRITAWESVLRMGAGIPTVSGLQTLAWI